MTSIGKMILEPLLFTALCCSAAAQKQAEFQVIVRDIKGGAVAGAAVRCSAEGNKIISYSDGSGSLVFNLAVCPGRDVEVSALGFTAERVRIEGRPETPAIVILQPTAIAAIVNVSGVDAPIGDTAFSVVSIDRSKLQTFGALALDDRLRQVPGFTLFRRSGSSIANPTAQGVSLRGVGASGASRALVIRDRIPLNDPFGGWVYWGRVPSGSIAEIEVLRGTASDIYGNAAVGGVVAINTLEAVVQPLGSVDVSYGSRRTPYVSGYGSAGVGSLIGSLGAELYGTDGFIPVANESRGPVDELSNVRRTTLTPMLERRRQTGSRIFLSGEYYREIRQNGTRLQNNDTLIRGLTAGVDETFEKFGSVALRAYYSDQLYHQSFSAISADRRTEALNRLQTVPSQMLGFSGQWTGSISRNVFIAGFDLRYIRGRSDETSIAQWVPTGISSSGGRESSGGVYIGTVLNFVPRTIISGGVRIDHWKESGGYSASRLFSTGLAEVTNFPVRNENAISPRASVLVRIHSNLSATATYGTSFRQPTLNELYRSFRVGNILTLANASLGAERGSNLEAAALMNGFGQRFYARIGAYCTTIEDAVSNMTVSVTPALITRMRQSIGATRTCGIEADTEVRPSSGVTLGLTYLHANPRVRRQPGNPALEGLFLPQVARDQLTARALFSRPKIGTASIQLRASDSQFEDDQNLLPLKGYVSLDAFISHPLSRRFAIYAAGENLTNSRIESGRTPVITLAGERSLRIGVRWGFGDR